MYIYHMVPTHVQVIKTFSIREGWWCHMVPIYLSQFAIVPIYLHTIRHGPYLPPHNSHSTQLPWSLSTSSQLPWSPTSTQLPWSLSTSTQLPWSPTSTQLPWSLSTSTQLPWSPTSTQWLCYMYKHCLYNWPPARKSYKMVHDRFITCYIVISINISIYVIQDNVRNLTKIRICILYHYTIYLFLLGIFRSSVAKNVYSLPSLVHSMHHAERNG